VLLLSQVRTAVEAAIAPGCRSSGTKREAGSRSCGIRDRQRPLPLDIDLGIRTDDGRRTRADTGRLGRVLHAARVYTLVNLRLDRSLLLNGLPSHAVKHRMMPTVFTLWTLFRVALHSRNLGCGAEGS
jgi:hypothetical protein